MCIDGRGRLKSFASHKLAISRFQAVGLERSVGRLWEPMCLDTMWVGHKNRG